MTVYLVDYIGVHCGMHYYMEAFKKCLTSIPNINVKILSNYSDDNNSAFFLNHYKGSKFKKGISLLRNLSRLKKFVKNHDNDLFIYLTYGNGIDTLFMSIIAGAPNHLIDIHEAIAQDLDSKEGLKNKFKNLYANRIKAVISHSQRTDDFLREYNFKGDVLHVPHFKYIFPKHYEQKNINPEISSSINPDKTNLLFFGNITENKGIDILFEAINLLDRETASKLNVIVAGKDFDGAVNRVPLKENRYVSLFLRHITDDELRYLYSNVDFLSLPYRKTSQSGILEMAFYFKKPIIATDVPYFRTTLEEFPSFGRIAGNNAKEYAEELTQIVNGKDSGTFFTDEDYARYENREEVNEFKVQFSNWINS